MNLLAVVNQLFQQDEAASTETPALLGIPSELVGLDLAALESALASHKETLEAQLGRTVHDAAALMDFLAQPGSGHEIDDFCVLRKDAMRDLVQAAIYDNLTGLYSRNTMDSRLREEFRRARRYHLPLSVLFVDVDDFKTINDNHGHSEGDRALSFLGRFILDRLREVDIPIRYGGEEFVILLPHTDGETALALANQLRDGIGSAQEDAGLAQPLTISIGVGTMAQDMTQESDLIDAADRAVYLAKEKKNLVWPGINGEQIDPAVGANQAR